MVNGAETCEVVMFIVLMRAHFISIGIVSLLPTGVA